MDTEKIKTAFDKFVEDDFLGSKEILRKEILKKKNDYLKDKLNLQKDVIKIEDDEE